MEIFWIVWALGFGLVLAYGFVLPFGAPYLPTREADAEIALDLLNLKAGQTFFDLGSGDGRVLVAAAKRGLKVTGYELNPFLAFYSWLITRRYGRRVKVRFGSFWRADLSSVDGVFVFLINHKMVQLDTMLRKYSKKHKIVLVSHAFKIPGKKVQKKSGAMLLYMYGPKVQN